MNTAILYSFRRCPYAMRARLAIVISRISVELREVELRDKPSSLLDISAKGTVPVLITADRNVIDESLDIMFWSLQQSDPDGWLDTMTVEQKGLAQQLIQENDAEFKYYLDRYKYADRYPDDSKEHYRQKAEQFLLLLEDRLATNNYLISSAISLADMAILPFIRQFAFVDKAWFDSSPYPRVRSWLQDFIESPLFESIMTKYPKWQEQEYYSFPLD